MIYILKNLFVQISKLRFFPHFVLFKLLGGVICEDVKASGKSFCELMLFEKTFRNLYYKRLGLKSWILMPLAPRDSSLSLDLNMPLGKGCHFMHATRTFIHAQSIGENFFCMHNVTIGNWKGLPVIGDNVKVYCGAIIVGDITIGNNVTIAAGAVVVKSVPDNCTVVGNPSFISKINGEKVHIML